MPSILYTGDCSIPYSTKKTWQKKRFKKKIYFAFDLKLNQKSLKSREFRPAVGFSTSSLVEQEFNTAGILYFTFLFHSLVFSSVLKRLEYLHWNKWIFFSSHVCFKFDFWLTYLTVLYRCTVSTVDCRVEDVDFWLFS